jgi:hypothetical protein
MHGVSERKRANIEGSLFSTGSQLSHFYFPFPGIQVGKHGWIPRTGGSSSMPPSRRITDHDEIRQWAALCQAVPAEVSAGEQDSQLPSLRFMFLDGSPNQPQLTPIAWEDFLAKFDLLGLVLVCEDSPTGQPGKAYELIRPR